MDTIATRQGHFDPDGYYLPTASVGRAGYELRQLELRTLEYYYDGAVHYDNPRFIPPKARITLEGPGGRATYDCARPTIERDTVFVLSQDVGFT